jgi:hypothetical protein
MLSQFILRKSKNFDLSFVSNWLYLADTNKIKFCWISFNVTQIHSSLIVLYWASISLNQKKAAKLFIHLISETSVKEISKVTKVKIYFDMSTRCCAATAKQATLGNSFVSMQRY